LEPFDAIGRLRRSDAGLPIDASGRLMDGSAVDGPASLRDALMHRPEIFVHTMTEKLMTYALGRGLESKDVPYIRSVMRSASRDDYRFSALVLGIINSMPFQFKAVATIDGNARASK
jgi:hypothetical protein